MRVLRSDLGPAFGRLWAAQTISNCGSQVTYLAIPLTAAVLLGASPAQMGLLAAVEQLPWLLVGPWAGVWADRLPRRALLVTTDVGRALLVGSVPLAGALGWLGMGWLYAVGALAGALAVVGGVAGGALLPSLVRRDQLVRANARAAASDAGVGVVGPALGGVLVQALGAPVALLADAASFLASAALLAGLPVEDRPRSTSGHPRVLRDLTEGLRAVAGDGLLRSLAVLLALRLFFGAAGAAPYVLFVTRELGVDPAGLGLLFSLGSAGLVLGAVAAPRLAGRIGLGRTLAAGVLSFAAASVAIVLAPADSPFTVPVLVLGQVFVGLGAQLFQVSFGSIQQACAPEQLRGRVGGAMAFAAGLGTTAGLVGGGLAGDGIGMRPTIALVALGEVVLAIAAMRGPAASVDAVGAPSLEPAAEAASPASR